MRLTFSAKVNRRGGQLYHLLPISNHYEDHSSVVWEPPAEGV